MKEKTILFCYGSKVRGISAHNFMQFDKIFLVIFVLTSFSWPWRAVLSYMLARMESIIAYGLSFVLLNV